MLHYFKTKYLYQYLLYLFDKFRFKVIKAVISTNSRLTSMAKIAIVEAVEFNLVKLETRHTVIP